MQRQNVPSKSAECGKVKMAYPCILIGVFTQPFWGACIILQLSVISPDTATYSINSVRQYLGACTSLHQPRNILACTGRPAQSGCNLPCRQDTRLSTQNELDLCSINSTVRIANVRPWTKTASFLHWYRPEQWGTYSESLLLSVRPQSSTINLTVSHSPSV